jgi:hypothetical protein
LQLCKLVPVMVCSRTRRAYPGHWARWGDCVSWPGWF